MNDYVNIASAAAGYTKTDLARAYFPNCVNDNTARRNLSRWLKRNPVLMEKLKQSGYQTFQHYLSPRQVRIIYDMLGEP